MEIVLCAEVLAAGFGNPRESAMLVVVGDSLVDGNAGVGIESENVMSEIVEAEDVGAEDVEAEGIEAEDVRNVVDMLLAPPPREKWISS